MMTCSDLHLDLHTVTDRLEQHLEILVDDFLAQPYRFFTEGDAVSTFYGMLTADAELGISSPAPDGQPTILIHREYPTFFRIDTKGKQLRVVEARGARGHYDLVLLDPCFVSGEQSALSAEQLTNRDVRSFADTPVELPFLAALEFKLLVRGLSCREVQAIRYDLFELQETLARRHAQMCYEVIFHRYDARYEPSAQECWGRIHDEGKCASDVRIVYAAYRFSENGTPVHILRYFPEDIWLRKAVTP